MSVINPATYIHYDTLSYPPLTKEVMDEEACLTTDIDYLEKQLGISREKAIYALTKCRRKYGEEVNLIQKAEIFCYNLKYDLKFKSPEKGIQSLIGIQSLADSYIWAENARPVHLSDTAREHYGVSTLEEMIGKQVSVFRRCKDESGNYETPYKYYLQKAKLMGLEYTHCLNMATAKVKTTKGFEPVNITRVCIDWEA